MYVLILGLFLVTFQVSCDGAPGPRLKIKHVEKRAVCKDQSPGCPQWEARGYCAQGSIYYNFMKETCQASCGFCKLPPTEPPQACRKNEYDKSGSYCINWKKEHGCKASSPYHQFMKENCYATCGYCIMPPTPVPQVDWNACLQAHNVKRVLHGAPPLVWDAELAQHAKAWADYLASNGKFEHAQNTGEGENLYRGSDSHVKTCSDAVESWYNEIKDYDFDNPGFSKATGHFTAVVWKSTTKLGAALTKIVNSNGATETYVVARYKPQGNVRGQFAQNVLRKIS